MIRDHVRLSPVAVLSVTALALLAACAPADAPLPRPTATAASVAPAATPAATECKDGKPVAASLSPSEATTGPAVRQIKRRKALRVATSGDVLLWGATDTETGNPEGYDVDLATEIAKRLDVPIQYVVIPYSQRLAALASGRVDLVAQQFTITCARWAGTAATATAPAAPGVNFSIPYYRAGARFLVSENFRYDGLDSLRNQTVCGTVGSTSLAAVAQTPGVKTVTAPSAGRCLVKFQEGEATVVVGDETTLAGFKRQSDRTTKIVGEAIGTGPYGLGLQPKAADLTRFVNDVLLELRADGELTRLYDRWMKPTVGGSAPALDPPQYGRDVDALDRS